MTNTPHALDFKPPQTITDPRELEAKMKNASSCREFSPFEDKHIDFDKSRAYEDHEAMIELGGRRTRKVLEKPAWKRPAWTAINEKDGLDGNVALDRKLMFQHWSKESEYFNDDLTRWKQSKIHQQIADDHPWSSEQQLGQLLSQQFSSASLQIMQNSTKPSHLPPYASESESSTVDLSKGLTVDSPRTFPNVHPTVQPLKEPVCGGPYSGQSSTVPDLEGGRRIQKGNITKRQAAVVSEDIDPVRAPVDDDICMTDTCEAIYSHETVGEGADTASVDSDMSDDDDIADRGLRGWISVPDPQYSIPLGQGGWISVPEVNSCGTRGVAKLPLNNCQLPSSRQTRSATKQDDIISSKTPMRVHKQSSKNVRPTRARTLESS